jgi:hypothetical protein
MLESWCFYSVLSGIKFSGLEREGGTRYIFTLALDHYELPASRSSSFILVKVSRYSLARKWMTPKADVDVVTKIGISAGLAANRFIDRVILAYLCS